MNEITITHTTAYGAGNARPQVALPPALRAQPRALVMGLRPDACTRDVIAEAIMYWPLTWGRAVEPATKITFSLPGYAMICENDWWQASPPALDPDSTMMLNGLAVGVDASIPGDIAYIIS